VLFGEVVLVGDSTAQSRIGTFGPSWENRSRPWSVAWDRGLAVDLDNTVPVFGPVAPSQHHLMPERWEPLAPAGGFINRVLDGL
jgi:hypothetical protein